MFGNRRELRQCTHSKVVGVSSPFKSKVYQHKVTEGADIRPMIPQHFVMCGSLMSLIKADGASWVPRLSYGGPRHFAVIS